MVWCVSWIDRNRKAFFARYAVLETVVCHTLRHWRLYHAQNAQTTPGGAIQLFTAQRRFFMLTNSRSYLNLEGKMVVYLLIHAGAIA